MYHVQGTQLRQGGISPYSKTEIADPAKRKEKSTEEAKDDRQDVSATGRRDDNFPNPYLSAHNPQTPSNA